MKMDWAKQLGRMFRVLLMMGASMAAGAGTAENHAEKCIGAVPDLFERVSPAVVSILATTINPYASADDRIERSVGSGFIFDKKGLILTNAHVVFEAQSLAVVLADGTALPANLIGADPIFDVAVVHIQVPANTDLPVVPLGDATKARVGEDVIAIGNPLALGQTLTRGVISGINRMMPVTALPLSEPFIQTDAAINPGNSGGPLLNLCGEVIGINTSLLENAQNIGFAIPVNVAESALPALLKDGHIIRPWLGFHGQLVDDTLQALIRVPLTTGFLVEAVEPGSPAEKAGLKGGQFELAINGLHMLLGGDIIVAMNGVPLDSADHVLQAVHDLKVGSRLKLKVFRDGKNQVIEYPLPERPLLPGDLRD
jgi:serine protease Do